MGRKTFSWSSSPQGWDDPHTGTLTWCPPSPAPGRGEPLKRSNYEQQGQEDVTETGRYKVEQCGLSVLVDVHHKYCEEEAGQISWTEGLELRRNTCMKSHQWKWPWSRSWSCVSDCCHICRSTIRRQGKKGPSYLSRSAMKMPGITMSPRPSMAKLVAPMGPFSKRSCN